MNDAYIHAIVNDSIDELKAILDSKDDNDIAKLLSGPGVHRAAHYGKSEVAKLLLGRGANIDAISKDGNGALHAVVKQGNADFVNLLIQHRCNINLRNSHRFTAVMIAIENGWTQILSLLLQNGADVNAADSLGDTAVHFAVEHGKVEMLEMLMQYKCNIDAQNRKGTSAIMTAVQKRNQNILALLTHAGADLSAKNNQGSNALMISVTTLNLNALHFLLEHFVKNKTSFDINAADINGQTALMLAASNQRSDMVKLLCDRGANTNLQNSISGQTALHYAVIFMDVPTVEALLDAGACVNVINKTLKTPLNFSNKKKMIEILLKAGAFKTEEMYSLPASTEGSISKHSERSTLLQNTQYYTDIQKMDNNEYAHINGEFTFELNDDSKWADDAYTKDASQPSGLPRGKQFKSKLRVDLVKRLNECVRLFWSEHSLSSRSTSARESRSICPSSVKFINIKECTQLNIQTTSSVVIGDNNTMYCGSQNAHNIKEETESNPKRGKSFKNDEPTPSETTTCREDETKSKHNSEDALKANSDLITSQKESDTSDATRKISSQGVKVEDMSDSRSDIETSRFRNRNDVSRWSFMSLQNDLKRNGREVKVIDNKSAQKGTTGGKIKNDVIVADKEEKSTHGHSGPSQSDSVSVPEEGLPLLAVSDKADVHRDISSRRGKAEEMSDSKSVIETTRLLHRNDATRWSFVSLPARIEGKGSNLKRVQSALDESVKVAGIKAVGESEKEKPNVLGSRTAHNKEQSDKENKENVSLVTKF